MLGVYWACEVHCWHVAVDDQRDVEQLRIAGYVQSLFEQHYIRHGRERSKTGSPGYRITLILLHLHAEVLHSMYGQIVCSQTKPLQGKVRYVSGLAHYIWSDCV